MRLNAFHAECSFCCSHQRGYCLGVAYIAHLSYRLAASFANCQHCRVGWIEIT
jgi:hypothetical protein